MVRDDHDALNEMLMEFRLEINKIEVQVQNNLRRVKEVNFYLKSLMGSESDDFKVFSPRRAEVIYKEEIDKVNKEVSDLEEENQELCRKKDVLIVYIHRLEDILERERIDEAVQWKNAAELQESSIQELKDMVYKIEQSSKVIERNPIQAKQDYVIIGKRLQEILDKIKGTVWMYRGDAE